VRLCRSRVLSRFQCLFRVSRVFLRSVTVCVCLARVY